MRGMSSLRFRQATLEDVPDLCRIRLMVGENRLSDPSRVPPELVVEYLSLRGRGWVCEAEGRVSGFSIAERDPASIWALFVEPRAQGQGIGHGLLERAVAWLREEGAGEVTLVTEPGTRAERFYRARGWVARGPCANGDIRMVLPAGG